MFDSFLTLCLAGPNTNTSHGCNVVVLVAYLTVYQAYAVRHPDSTVRMGSLYMAVEYIYCIYYTGAWY